MHDSYPHTNLPHHLPSLEERRARGERQAAQRLATWPADGDPSALVVLVLRLFPLGQGIYPRRRYGLRELPLHRINQGLARYGLTLEGHSVRREEEVPPPPAWLAAILGDMRARRGADASN